MSQHAHRFALSVPLELLLWRWIMHCNFILYTWMVCLVLAGPGWIFAQSTTQIAPKQNVPPLGCLAFDSYFENEVWAKVGERVCWKCHNPRGDAAESQFVLQAIRSSDSVSTLRSNREAFYKLALSKNEKGSVLLQKVLGDLDHGGGEVLKSDSKSFQILKTWVDRLDRKPTKPVLETPESLQKQVSFFAGVRMQTPQALLRRVSLSLAGRLPSNDELQMLEKEGNQGLERAIEKIMEEEAFLERLREAFNDIFLTVGIEDNAETLLSYEHFEHTRLWYDQYNLDHLPEADRQKERWRIADVYRKALLREPLELIAFIVKNNRPFTEIATADYIMVSPYTSRGYGIFDSIRDQFKDHEDPFEYIQARIPALKSREGHVQESPSGMFPHAGILGTFHYLRRYPTTETNRNRLRARMFYQHFLGIDIMQLAPRTTDASAVAAKFDIPTMKAPDCVVCHRTIDPVAGIFQDFDNEGNLRRKKDGWYTDMFDTGFEGEKMPAEERWRATQWLAERAVKDPRFPIAMVEHVYFILTGRKVLQAPEDVDDPMFLSRRRAYLAQRKTIENVSRKFVDSNFNLKVAFKGLIGSSFYRADGLNSKIDNPERSAELDDVGIVRLLSPEQLERKIKAIFGKTWGRLNDEWQVLYGGIDSITVTERNGDPSGAMGAIQRLMANDVACYHVARDFRKAPSDRILFPNVEPSIVPNDDDANRKIREGMVHLHRLILGQQRAINSPEIDRTFELFSSILDDARSTGYFEPRETYYCGGREDYYTEDKFYTIRAWRAVVTYLLRQHEFLYE